MKIDNQTTQKDLVSRLNRLEGQVHGITRMVQENRDCTEIMQQLSAARSALHGATLVFLRDSVNQCMSRKDATERDQSMLVDELMKMLKNT